MNRFGLFGFPLGHSFSKQFFNNKFKTENLNDCFFELFPLTDISNFPKLISEHSDLKGLAVTIPYKESVTNFLTSIDDVASEIGAVNCIKIASGITTGYNTDVIGFENSIKPILKPHHKKALILGTGGGSKAIQFVFKKLGIEYLVVSRTGKHPFIQYQQIDELICTEYSIIVNTTPLGMSPQIDNFPEIPYQFLNENHLLFDLIYNPDETLFLQKGKAAGAQTKNGYEMLLLQAEANWEIWNQ